MPLAKGKSKRTVSSNIRELHKGKTFARTAAKQGKAKANSQAVAIALSTARRSGSKSAAGKRAAKK
jgi:hypothetical protein